MLNYVNRIFLGIFFTFLVTPTIAAVYSLPPENSNIIGEPQIAILQKDQNLQELAQRYGVGYYEVLEANPTLNPKQVQPGTEVIMPTQFILPDAPREGVVVNLAELRLYYYPPDSKEVMTFPVGIGKAGWETPVTVTAIKDKRVNPLWVVPESVYQDMLKRGYKIDRVWAPGPNNPLGKHAMRLTLQGYDIHGSNRNEGVGRRTSAGCVRMYPDDVAALFARIDVGTKVTIINQPIKLGYKGKTVYLEAHQPLKEEIEKTGGNFVPLLQEQIARAGSSQRMKIDLSTAKVKVAEHTGLVYEVGAL